jgi:hypothetical protein
MYVLGYRVLHVKVGKLTVKGNSNKWFSQIDRLLNNETQIIHGICAVIGSPSATMDENSHGKVGTLLVAGGSNHIDRQTVLRQRKWPGKAVL